MYVLFAAFAITREFICVGVVFCVPVCFKRRVVTKYWNVRV